VIDPAFNDRWQGESDATSGDRPGIVASLLRYRKVVVAVTVLGAVAGYGIAQTAPVRYQADAVLILSEPGDPSVLGGGDEPGSIQLPSRRIPIWTRLKPPRRPRLRWRSTPSSGRSSEGRRSPV
jgi:hypothetical protein